MTDLITIMREVVACKSHDYGISGMRDALRMAHSCEDCIELVTNAIVKQMCCYCQCRHFHGEDCQCENDE